MKQTIRKNLLITVRVALLCLAVVGGVSCKTVTTQLSYNHMEADVFSEGLVSVIKQQY